MKVYGRVEETTLELRRARPDVIVEWRPAEQRRGERLGDVYLQEPLEGTTEWWLSEDLTDLLGTRTNYDAERRLVNRVRSENARLLRRLEFDTEGESVVVRAKTKGDLVALAELIEQMAKERTTET